MSIIAEFEEAQSTHIGVRHHLHQHPELGFDEHRTSDFIAAELMRLDIPFHRGIGRTGIVGIIKGKSNTRHRAVGLRADMDALPMQEPAGRTHASRNAGVMHACGHDGHMAILLAAAGYLQRTRDFDGVVYIIFQPAEEGRGGAKAMVEDGLFERFPMQQIYALHNWPSLPLGTVSIANGPAMAATDRMHVTIHGVGGHGGLAPHKTIDPIAIAGQLITAVNTIVSRNLDPLEGAVISLCGIAGGNLDAFAVVPEEVRLVGTARSLDAAVQDRLEKRFHETVHGIAHSFGATATVSYERLFPATVNTPAETRLATEVAVSLFGRDNVEAHPKPSLAGEDFAVMLQACPGAYIHLGTGRTTSDPGLHHPKFDFNDEAIPLGASLLSRIAETALA